MSRFYAEYWHDTPVVNVRGWWRIYDRYLTFGAGDTMPIAQCWTRADAFHIRDLLNAEEDSKREPVEMMAPGTRIEMTKEVKLLHFGTLIVVGERGVITDRPSSPTDDGLYSVQLDRISHFEVWLHRDSFRVVD